MRWRSSARGSQLDRARAEINERGELPYPTRVDLLRTFDAASAKTALGWARRASLALDCARESASLWVEDESQLDLNGMLDFAEQCMREQSMLAELEDAAENLRTIVEDILAMGESRYVAAYAGFATVAAARAVIHDQVMDDTASSEKTLEVSQWDSAFWTSCALAGGASWEEGTNDESRRRFWLWYLNVAIPRVLSTSNPPAEC